MAFVAGFSMESATADVECLSLVGTSSYDTSTVRTGARSLRCNPASGASGFGQDSQALQTANWNSKYVHFGLYVATLPSVARSIFGQANSQINMRLNTDGTLSYKEGASVLASSTTALTTGQWYWIGVRVLTGSSVVVVQINGADAITASPSVSTMATANLGCEATEASSIDLYFDDVILDDAGFLASSKVDIALPISDNTRTGTTAGAGGTTNLWDAINNTPPAGLASASETNTSNIEFPASTTCDYLANLETYTTLGIGASDTVLAVRSIVRHGEDIATGTKNLQNVGALTNPTVAGSSVTAGSDGGAHGAETGLWVTTFGTLTTSPSVTLGTSPTIRTSRTSESRVACIDFMGMLVAWTPVTAAAASLLPPHHNRSRIIR